MYNVKHVFIFTILLAAPLLLLHSCTAESITGENPPNNTDSLDFPVTFGGSGEDRGKSLLQTPDNGFLVLGTTTSPDGDFDNIARGNRDTYLLKKTNSEGELSWIQTYGGNNSDWGQGLIETNDGGYVVVGYSRSNEGFSTVPNQGGNDIFIMKVDSFGNQIWSQTYGGSDEDLALDVTEALNGDLLITGESRSNDKDFDGINKGYVSSYLMRLNNNGEIQWIITYGGSGTDVGNSVIFTNNNFFAITGYTFSSDGDFKGDISNSMDIFLLKTDLDGNIE